MVNRKSGKSNLIVLFLVAVIMLVGAVALYQSQEKSGGQKFQKRKLFPSLNLGDIAQVKISSESDTVDIKKKGDDTWGLESRGGYTIEGDRLHRLVIALADLEAADQMTNNKEKYAKMGLSEAKPENGRVQFFDKEGKVLAGVFIGATRTPPGGDGGFVPPDGQYIRIEGDDYVYKIKDEIQVDKSPTSWLAKEVLKVDAAHLQAVKLDSPKTTDTYSVARVGTEPFKLTSPIPDGFKDKTTMVDGVGRCLSNVQLSDVLPASDPKVAEVDFSTTLTATQKNGLVYTVGVGKLLEDRYIRVAASYDSAADLSLRDERTSDTVAAKALEKAETAVANINARHGGWLYKVASYQADNIARKFSDLIEVIKPPVPDEAAPSPGESGAASPPMPSQGEIEAMIKSIEKKEADKKAGGASPAGEPPKN